MREIKEIETNEGHRYFYLFNNVINVLIFYVLFIHIFVTIYRNPEVDFVPNSFFRPCCDGEGNGCTVPCAGWPGRGMYATDPEAR